MNHDTFTTPELPATEAVAPGPVAVAAVRPRPAQALWARVGLLGIAAAALIAAAILVFGSGARPAGTLAAAGESNGGSSDVANLNGGPGFPGAFDGRAGHFGFGGITITGISGNDISLATEDGWTRTITVDSGTTYAKAGETIALGDLAVGDRIGFRQTHETDGTWTIDRIVVVLPHVGGEVTAIDGTTITVQQRDGTTATVTVNGGTTYMVNGADASLADVKVGMLLVAEGESTGDNAITAARVRAGDFGPMGGRGFRMGDGDGDGPGFGPGYGPGNGPNATTAPQATDSAS